jgi:hypothetical protein
MLTMCTGVPSACCCLLQVCTNNCVLKSFDITQMSKQDATFSAPFSLTVQRCARQAADTKCSTLCCPQCLAAASLVVSSWS